MLRSFALISLLLAASLQGADMVVFGDSLSDTGYSEPPATNPGGLLWHEYLADDLGLARATTSNSGQNGLNLAIGGSKVADLQAQVTRYTGRHTWQSGDLCTLWIGGNDILFDPGQNMSTLTFEIGSIITQLAAQGIDHFVVPNLPDVGAFPAFAGNPSAAAARTSGTLLFNAALATELNSKASSLGVRIDQPDVYGYFEAVLGSPADLGFVNVTQPLENAPGADPDTYAFWDVVHPTTRSHDLIGALARALVDPAGPIEVVTSSIQPDGSLHQTWLADPNAQYDVLSGTDLNALSPAATVHGSPVHTVNVDAPGPQSGYYRTRRSGP